MLWVLRLEESARVELSSGAADVAGAWASGKNETLFGLVEWALERAWSRWPLVIGMD